MEQIDLGEAEGPRTIVSGLVKYVPMEQLQVCFWGAHHTSALYITLHPRLHYPISSHPTVDSVQDQQVIVLANLKPRNMRGIKSNGMLLCASNAEHTEVEPLLPPAGAAIGERVYFGEEGASQPEAANPNQVQVGGCACNTTWPPCLVIEME